MSVPELPRSFVLTQAFTGALPAAVPMPPFNGDATRPVVLDRIVVIGRAVIGTTTAVRTSVTTYTGTGMAAVIGRTLWAVVAFTSGDDFAVTIDPSIPLFLEAGESLIVTTVADGAVAFTGEVFVYYRGVAP